MMDTYLALTHHDLQSMASPLMNRKVHRRARPSRLALADGVDDHLSLTSLFSLPIMMKPTIHDTYRWSQQKHSLSLHQPIVSSIHIKHCLFSLDLSISKATLVQSTDIMNRNLGSAHKKLNTT
jgi:hypothetical protein